jgi:Secretion system C-terminal sorting domain
MLKSSLKSFWIIILSSHIAMGQVLWLETFTAPDPAAGSTVDVGTTAWTTIQPPGGTFATDGGGTNFFIYQTAGEGVWISEWVDISTAPGTGYAILDLDVAIPLFTGTNDYVRAYYSLDGGPETIFYEVFGGLFNADATGTGVVFGDSVQITIRSDVSGFLSSYTLDNISLTAITTLYSRKTGNWDDVSAGNGTWSTVALGGVSCDCAPSNSTRLVIGNSNIVSVNLAAITTEINILNTGTLQWTSINDISLRGDLNVNSGGILDKNGITGANLFLGFIIAYSIVNDGTMDIGIINLNEDASSLSVVNDGTMTIEDFDFNGAAIITLSGAGDITISGNILVGDDITFTNNNTGTVTVGNQINFESIGGNNSSFFINNGTMNISNRIFIDDDDPSITNNGTMTITNNIQVGGSNDDNWDFTNTGILTFSNLSVANSNFTFDNSGSISNSGGFFNMGGTEFIRNNTPGSWNYGRTVVDAGTELYCDNDGVNTFIFDRSGAQGIITPQDSYWNLSLSGSGNKSLQGNINIKGDFSITNPASLSAGTNGVSFTGTIAQNITRTTAGSISFFDLIVNNTSGATPSVTAGNNVSSIVISNSLTLTEGITEMMSTSTPGMTMNAGTTLNGVSSTSFVDGPFTKIGISAFEFPIGDGTVWAPLRISAPTTAGASFTAQYVFGLYPDLTTDGSFDHVSGIEYWNLDRNISSDTVTVRLLWKNDVRSEISDLADLRVARYNTGLTQWESEGQSANSGTLSPAGWVESNAVSTFSPFTFASQTGINALPIELVSFSGQQEEDMVSLSWLTVNEINSDFFTLERSFEGKEFIQIARLQAKGFSQEETIYNFPDAPSKSGTLYYRLSQTDLDGSTQIFDVINVNFLSPDLSIAVYPNPLENNQLNILFSSAPEGLVQLSIFSPSGKISLQKTLSNPMKNISWNIKGRVPEGLYFLRIDSKNGKFFSKLIVE